MVGRFEDLKQALNGDSIAEIIFRAEKKNDAFLYYKTSQDVYNRLKKGALLNEKLYLDGKKISQERNGSYSN